MTDVTSIILSVRDHIWILIGGEILIAIITILGFKKQSSYFRWVRDIILAILSIILLIELVILSFPYLKSSFFP